MNTTTKHHINRLFYVFGGVVLTLLLIISVLRVSAGSSTTVYSNGFEADTADWAGSGTITKTATGTNGIASSSGDFHAVVSGSHTGPNTQLGGYSNTWTGDWQASIDIYLDPSWSAGNGFIYSVAVNKPDGTALRDFAFNAGVLNDSSTGNTNKFVVLADTAGSPNSDPLHHIKAMPAEKRAEITQAGWYTVQHSFKNVNGRLVTTVSLINSSKTTIKSWTIDYPWMNDMIATDVGGNRYGWFTHAAVPGGISIDNANRTISTNQYTVSASSTEPAILELSNNQTFTFSDINNGTITTPADLTVTGSANNIGIFIPAGTVITAENSNWDGVFNAPIITSINPSKLIDKKAHLLVKVGANTPLVFSKPVKLVLPGQAGRSAGYLDNAQGAFRAINTKCSNDPVSTLTGNIAECYLNEGNDLVIWTNHFSTYLSYTPTSVQLADTGTNRLLLTTTGSLLLASCCIILMIRKRQANS